MKADESVKKKFLDALQMFVFFHLGSDAGVDVTDLGEGVRVAIEHRRVRPFEIRVDAAQLESLVSDPDALETLFLENLTRNRRS